jgi:hypothetical protein
VGGLPSAVKMSCDHVTFTLCGIWYSFFFAHGQELSFFLPLDVSPVSDAHPAHITTHSMDPNTNLDR